MKASVYLFFALLAAIQSSCENNNRRRVCDFYGWIVVEKSDHRKNMGWVFYTLQRTDPEDRNVAVIKALQIDFDAYNVGDTIKQCH